MRKVRSILWRFTKWGSLALCLIGISGYVWVKGIYKGAFSEEEFTVHLNKIESAKDLGDSFYETYEKVYPKSLSSNWMGKIAREELLGKDRQPCPCDMLSRMQFITLQGESRLKNMLLEPSLSWAYESELTQRQCFNAAMANWDFLYNHRSIHEASEGYYGKSVKELELNDQLELIVMIKNNSLYNKLRRPELLSEKVAELKRKIKN